MKQIAVLGTGAIGGSIAADLAKAGCEPAVIDPWPEHVAAMRARGLRVVMPDDDVQVPVRAYHLCDLASARLEFDLVILASKSNDHRWLAEFIKPHLKSDGVLWFTLSQAHLETTKEIYAVFEDRACLRTSRSGSRCSPCWSLPWAPWREHLESFFPSCAAARHPTVAASLG